MHHPAGEETISLLFPFLSWMLFLWFHFLFPISLLSSNLTFFSQISLCLMIWSLYLISLSFSKWYLSLAASTSAWELKHFCRRRPCRVLGRLPALHPTSAQNSPSSSSASSSSSLSSGFSFFGNEDLHYSDFRGPFFYFVVPVPSTDDPRENGGEIFVE